MTDIPNDFQIQRDTQKNLPGTDNHSHETDSECDSATSTIPKENLKPPTDHSVESSSPIESLECHQDTSKTEKAITSTAINNSSSQAIIEQQLLKSKRDLESMVLKYAKSERENLQNKQKADELDKKLKRTIKDNDQLANRIKILTNDKNQLTDTLNAKVAQLTVLEQKNSYLNNVQGVKLKEYEERIKKLEVTNEELLTLIDSYKSKEGELLDFSERLSMKHMMLQTELDEALKKAPNYKDQYEEISKEYSELCQKITDMNEEMKTLHDKLRLEHDRSEKLKAERDENELNFSRQVDQLQNEIKVIRRKHQIAIKELVKEIRQLQGRLEKLDPDSRTSITSDGTTSASTATTTTTQTPTLIT